MLVLGTAKTGRLQETKDLRGTLFRMVKKGQKGCVRADQKGRVRIDLKGM